MDLRVEGGLLEIRQVSVFVHYSLHMASALFWRPRSGLFLTVSFLLGGLYFQIYRLSPNFTLAIHCITKCGGPWSIQATIRHIKHLIAFDRDTISHIYHEDNQADDLLVSESWDLRCYFECSALDLPRHYCNSVQIDGHELPTVRCL
ncbi:Uncharacterized protein Adt_45237 [Abeliophyllum distichum]|uniref:Uncharacterized protein n=1 Tax=Abeliophyllum distichum TaxID=126358 RepID=A0ABD1PD87_9LAMI